MWKPNQNLDLSPLLTSVKQMSHALVSVCAPVSDSHEFIGNCFRSRVEKSIALMKSITQLNDPHIELPSSEELCSSPEGYFCPPHCQPWAGFRQYQFDRWSSSFMPRIHTGLCSILDSTTTSFPVDQQGWSWTSFCSLNSSTGLPRFYHRHKRTSFMYNQTKVSWFKPSNSVLDRIDGN